MIAGMRIKELRTLAGMSQEELGRRVGVQRAAIQKYEKGSVTNIPVVTIEKIAKVFDVSPSYLLGWDENQHNQLALEVKILRGLSKYYGEDTVTLLESYCALNSKGKKRVQQYASDMERIPSFVAEEK